MTFTRSFERRVQSAALRIGELSSLRRVVALPQGSDITKHQWAALQLQLDAVEARLKTRLKRAADQHLGTVEQLQSARNLNGALGAIEMELSRAFTFFDTYMDVLTQRHTPGLGRLLAGCDAVLMCEPSPGPQMAALEALIHAVEKGRIPLKRIEDALARHMRVKERFLAPPRRRPASGAALRAILGRDEHQAVAAEMARFA